MTQATDLIDVLRTGIFTVPELCEATQLSQSTVYRHLKALKAAKQVIEPRRGNYTSKIPSAINVVLPKPVEQNLVDNTFEITQLARLIEITDSNRTVPGTGKTPQELREAIQERISQNPEIARKVITATSELLAFSAILYGDTSRYAILQGEVSQKAPYDVVDRIFITLNGIPNL